VDDWHEVPPEALDRHMNLGCVTHYVTIPSGWQ
jgi:hypothetical protein